MTEENNKKYEGQGNNWTAFFAGDHDIQGFIKHVVESPGATAKRNGDFSGIINLQGPVKALVLIKVNPENAEVYSAYPFLQISNRVEVEIKKIDEWSNGVEAVISGSVGPASISFFDTLYFFNKGKYEVGKKYIFEIGALAHSFIRRDEKDLIMIPDAGPLKGEKLYTHKMTSFLPVHEYPAEFQFTCPFINFSGETNSYNQNFKLFPFWLRSNDTEVPIISFPMYVNSKVIKGEPKANDSIQGVGWLQGYLTDSFEELLK